jgi:hypothetical protein
MLHVLRRYAERNDTTLIEAANEIIWPFSNAQYDHPWTRYLNESCERPDYYRGKWPEDKCRKLLLTIDNFIAGNVKDPCASRGQEGPSGWRSPRSKALRYALRHGYQRVKCQGGTSLAFVKEKKNAQKAIFKKAKAISARKTKEGHPSNRRRASTHRREHEVSGE